MDKVQKNGAETCVKRKLNYSDIKHYVFRLAARNRVTSDVMLQELVDYLDMLCRLERVQKQVRQSCPCA
jgi:hypothetical protein